MASLQQSAAEREQALLFERQVSEEQERFTDQIEFNLDEFDDAVAFMSATFPGTIQQYERFFEGSNAMGGVSELDPGITLIERVEADRVDELINREAVLGNPSFRVLAFGPLLNGRHHVITRTASPVDLSGLSLIGLDLGGVSEELSTAFELPNAGRQIFALGESSVIASLLADESEASKDLNPIIVLEQVQDPVTGELQGWAAQFFNPVLFLQELVDTQNPSINVTVELLGASERISEVTPRTDSTFETAMLKSELAGSTEGLTWQLNMWAEEDFGVGTGLRDQTGVLLFGLLITLGLFTLALWRALHEHRFDKAKFELEHARTLATTDPLTGLLNRQGFLETVEESGHGAGGTVFFIDLDGFKSVNDERGHAAGDAVLRGVAGKLHEQFRGADIVSRFGGDEFVVFAPGLAGEQIEEAISARVVEAISELDGAISASLGTAVLKPQSPVPFEDVLNRADSAMYSAKKQGGGQFASAATGALDESDAA